LACGLRRMSSTTRAWMPAVASAHADATVHATALRFFIVHSMRIPARTYTHTTNVIYELFKLHLSASVPPPTSIPPRLCEHIPSTPASSRSDTAPAATTVCVCVCVCICLSVTPLMPRMHWKEFFSIKLPTIIFNACGCQTVSIAQLHNIRVT